MIFSNPKKEHFKQSILNLNRKMWDAEFLITKKREEHEGYRVEFDRLSEMIDASQVRLKQEQEKEDPDKTIVENMQKLIERLTPDMEQLKKQMDQVDREIEGYNYEEQGQKFRQQGLVETIDQYRALIKLVEKHMKKI